MGEPDRPHGLRTRRLPRMLLWLCFWVYLLTWPFIFVWLITEAYADSTAVPAPRSQEAAWVAAKLAFRVTRPTPPGSAIAPPACTGLCASYPVASVLDTRVVQDTLEPPVVGTDAAGHPYADHNMSRLCGAGAVANTLYFWGKGPSTAGPATHVDPANGVATYWTTDHNRAYLLSLAWETVIPGWRHAGLMDTHDPSWGVTLYGVRDGLNWEASNHDASAWQTYFYTLVWWNQSSAEEFHQHVRDDVANAHVPVVAEVSARRLPNWSPQGKPIRHFITVVGYDDSNGIYYYTDSCGKSTGCGALSDGGVHAVSQGRLWEAISAIPVNASTAEGAGDGGYVW
ncbi:MAG TPA: C39 family peptidase [Ktedonobacterales bacterium]